MTLYDVLTALVGGVLGAVIVWVVILSIAQRR